MTGAAQRMSPGDLERAWYGTTYVTGRPGAACLGGGGVGVTMHVLPDNMPHVLRSTML